MTHTWYQIGQFEYKFQKIVRSYIYFFNKWVILTQNSLNASKPVHGTFCVFRCLKLFSINVHHKIYHNFISVMSRVLFRVENIEFISYLLIFRKKSSSCFEEVEDFDFEVLVIVEFSLYSCFSRGISWVYMWIEVVR